MPPGPVQIVQPEPSNKNEAAEEAPATKPIVGIIYPPPEVRNIVDKTASFVARNGPEFEARIRQNEINNPKFNFLNPTDPYHAYYRHKVTEFKEGRAQEPSAAVPKVMQQAMQLPQKVQVIQETIVPKEPPPEFEFIADPPSIAAFDLDVVKLTAQFVARNGRQFLTQLMQKEQRNYQFDFLRPQHSLFNYFTKLVEQYTKILIPPKGLLAKLKREAENPREVLDQVRYRVEWAKFQERERKKEEEEREKERVAYAQIDWHDFVVVETVDFQPIEQGHFPPPTTPEELGARILIQERYEKYGESEEVEMEVESEDEDDRDVRRGVQPPQPDQDTQVQDMDEGSDDEDEGVKVPLPPDNPMPPPLPPTPDQVIIRKDYDPKASRPPPTVAAQDEYLISPITGEKIPASKMQEHMRIGLLDPRWLEQRDRSIRDRQTEDEVYAPGLDIESSLKQLAERRTDIFGVEETAIGKKIGEEEIQKPEEKDDGSSLGSDSEISGFTGDPQTDKYGFIGGAQQQQDTDAPTPDVPLEVVRQREVKWLDMLRHWDKWLIKRNNKVRLRCQKGIPPALRGRAWLYLSGGKVKREQNQGKFLELDQEPGDPKWLDVIEKDLHRQFPFHEMFVSRGGHGQQDLFRVLKAYTLYRPEEGYCQAQAPIAAVLLMHMPAEDAFWGLVQICEKYLPGYYSPGLEAVQLDGEILFALLRRVSPLAFRHLEQHKMEPILYMTEWFMCAFSRTLPWASVLRVWDMFLCDGVKIIFRVGLVLLKCMLGTRDKLKACQGQYETMELLKTIDPRCMQEGFLVREVQEVPVTARDVDREHHTQLKRWRKNRGELRFKAPPRMHGARPIVLAEPPRCQDLLQNPNIRLERPPPTPQLKKGKERKKSMNKSKPIEEIPNPYSLPSDRPPPPPPPISNQNPETVPLTKADPPQQQQAPPPVPPPTKECPLEQSTQDTYL
ncbi:splicing factor 3A subunit 1 isoform X1 [Brachionichthys hirsutus]|uniref:splicing factor 3A subunit 1 isoform X1 n=1 Tax=Brachionichthys hirsutus TaxID=412623 RepID=UPI003604518A